MSGLTSVKNALPTALLVFVAQKVVATSQGATDIPMDVQMEGALVGGASAVAVDSTMRGQMPLVRAIACGGLLAGGMYVWKGDQMWMLWLPTGALSYFMSDWATAQMQM
jgi:hypothetical protein